MGLDIKKYSYGYSMLHQLREAALKVENNLHTLKQVYEDADCGTKFIAFIQHADNEGGYRSTTSKRFKEIEEYSTDWYYWGHSLEKLKEECEELNKSIHNYLNEFQIMAWEDFYADVKSAKKVLEFH